MSVSSVSSKEVMQTCLAGPQCSLCRFEFAHKEWFVACKKCCISSAVANLTFAIDTIDGRWTREFRFADCAHFEDEDKSIAVHTCVAFIECPWYCKSMDRSYGFHPTCLLFEGTMPVTRVFLTATRYLFQPSAIERERQRQRRKYLLTSKLARLTEYKLPTEVLHMITKLLLRECAIVTLQSLRIGLEPSEEKIYLTRNVYGTYVTIDGVQYLQRLSNRVPEADSVWATLLNVSKLALVRRVDIAFDHQGIRTLCFSASNSPIVDKFPAVGLWWKNIQTKTRIMKIRGKNDVSTPINECFSDLTCWFSKLTLRKGPKAR